MSIRAQSLQSKVRADLVEKRRVEEKLTKIGFPGREESTLKGISN